MTAPTPRPQWAELLEATARAATEGEGSWSGVVILNQHLQPHLLAYIAAASPDVVLALLDERDRLHRIAEAARRVAGIELGVILPTDDGLAAYIEAKNDLLAALQGSPDDR